MVSSLRMQLDESNAEKRHLHYENKNIRGRLEELERSEKARTLHWSSMQEKDTTAREFAHGRSSGHGMDGTENPSQPRSSTSVMRAENAQLRDQVFASASDDHSAGESNLAATEVSQTLWTFVSSTVSIWILFC